jgi:hypothetical protein
MTNQLASELEVEGNRFAGLDALRVAMQKLDSALGKTA